MDHHKKYHPGPPPPPYSHMQPTGSYAYVPTGVTVVYPNPPPAPPAMQPTYVTNYIYQQAPPPPPPAVHIQHEPVVYPPVSDMFDWVPASPHTASSLAHRAYVGGKEGWDGSPLWIIRAHHNGELIPGKFAVKHKSAYIPHACKEIPVHNFEVLCAPPRLLRWTPASHGQIPPGAYPAGNTCQGEPLYIGRARHMMSLTPGKVHQSHSCCYISYGGKEISHKNYEVLCRADHICR